MKRGIAFKTDRNHLVEHAKEAREKAYAPYSNFKVGAAVLTARGEVYRGSNVENAAYPLCLCAERVALTKAYSEGDTKILEIAVVADTKNPVAPCGSCRQVISELCMSITRVHMANMNGDIKTMTIEDLLPGSFSSKDMGK